MNGFYNVISKLHCLRREVDKNSQDVVNVHQVNHTEHNHLLLIRLYGRILSFSQYKYGLCLTP